MYFQQVLKNQDRRGLGFKRLIVFDHVLGADTTHYRDWQGPYHTEDTFHEPFVLFGYLAASSPPQRLQIGCPEALARRNP